MNKPQSPELCAILAQTGGGVISDDRNETAPVICAQRSSGREREKVAVALRSGVVTVLAEKGSAILLNARYWSSTILGPVLVCSTSPAPLNGPLFTAHSISSTASSPGVLSTAAAATASSTLVFS